MSQPAQLGINGTKNRWDELQMSHIIQSNDIHDVGQFWPWHRYYMRVHEVLLQQECNYTGAQPYWDEQRDADAGSLEDASVFGSDDLSFGSNGREGDRCVIDGPFANSTLRLDQAWGVINYDEYCLGRNFTESYWAWANSTYADTCFAATTYDDAWSCYSVKPHSSAHLAVSGTVSIPSCILRQFHHQIDHIADHMSSSSSKAPVLETLCSTCITLTSTVSGGNGSKQT